MFLYRFLQESGTGTLKLEQADFPTAAEVCAPPRTLWHSIIIDTCQGVEGSKKVFDCSSANLQHSEGAGLVLVGALQSQRAPQFHQTSGNTHDRMSEALGIFLPP